MSVRVYESRENFIEHCVMPALMEHEALLGDGPIDFKGLVFKYDIDEIARNMSVWRDGASLSDAYGTRRLQGFVKRDDVDFWDIVHRHTIE